MIRSRIKRTLLLFIAIVLSCGAFAIGQEHPRLAVILMWNVLFILYWRETLEG